VNVAVEVVPGGISAALSSAAAVLTLLQAPVIVSQPASQTRALEAPVSFIVTAEGHPLNYQWMKEGVPITGATSEVLHIESVQSSDAGIYSVVVSSPSGSVTSEPAVLRVLVPARFEEFAYDAGAGEFRVSFATRPGLDYTIEWTDDFTPPVDWRVASAFAGDGEVYRVSLPGPPGTRFYRVQVE
jgi:hypothetical protein